MSRIEKKESKYIEYKRKFSDKVLREVVAFLNTMGGTIFVGVEDDGEITGIENPDKESLRIKDKIKDGILPSVLGLFDIEILHVEDISYIKITVAKGNDTPFYIKAFGMSEKGCFIRNGSSSDPIPTSKIDELYSRRVRNSLSRIISPRQDLTFSQLRIYYEEKGYTVNDNFLKNLELYTNDGKYNYNAYMLADDNGVSMKVAVYNGLNKVDLIENSENGYCSLLKATYRVLDKLDKYNTTHTKITGKPQREQWQDVDGVALREAVINAIIHNDYATNEVPPVFEFYDDRFEITSMGGLPAGMTEEDFFSGVSNPKNKVLMRVFKDMELVEHLGSGMGRILKKYDKSIFTISQNYIRISFKFRSRDDVYEANQMDRKWVANGSQMGRKWTAKEMKILKYLDKYGSVTSKEVSDLLSVSKTQTNRILSKLCSEDAINREGNGRGTFYTLK